MLSFSPNSMFARTLAIGLLAFGLSACADAPDDVDVAVTTADDRMSADAPAGDPMTDPTVGAAATADTSVTAQSTVDAATASGGVTSIPAAAALANINGWIAKLEGNADAAPVVANLRTLRDQLSATPIDGAAVGQTLTELGEQTTAAAAGAGDQQASLEALGGALSEAGAALSN